ncbi:MAG: serine/threonine-protein kinase [Acidobacteriota bacterium]
MDSRRVFEVVDAVVDLPAAQRQERIDTLCGDDEDLRREVERLVGLEATVDGVAVHPSGEMATPERLGPYRLLDVLGQGGMGTVYRAVREDDFEKEVALKILRPERLSRPMIERFHAERQILARLEHPNIAYIFDGGTLEDGRPYLVMELVEGEPVDRYCQLHVRDRATRLRLFLQIASAVAFAHRNLVVHRDIKPGNVLVTRDGVPKLLDFGIAKLVSDEGPVVEPTTLSDVSGAMTLRYASPEQVAGDAVTTASDVYALGLLLHTMLTGTLPCGLADCALSEAAGRILTAAPEPTGEGGDLDAIVGMALAKDPSERYASATELVDDVDRFLRHLPVRARQGGRAYAAGKLARRHPWGAMAALLFVVFSITSTVFWREAVVAREVADRERILAVRAQERAERVSVFLKDLFRSADPNAARGGRQTVREVLDEGRERLEDGLEGEPELEAALVGTLGDVYRNLGLHDEAVELMRRSVELRRALYPEGDLRLAVSLNDLASVLYYMERYSEAERALRESLALRRRLGAEPTAIAQALNNLASVLTQQGELAGAGSLYEEALALRRLEHGEQSTVVASSLYSLGVLRLREGDLEVAEPLLRQALDIYVGAYGERHTRVASVLHTLGRLVADRGAHDEARELLERALTVRSELLGDDDARVASTRADLELLAAGWARPD